MSTMLFSPGTQASSLATPVPFPVLPVAAPVVSLFGFPVTSLFRDGMLSAQHIDITAQQAGNARLGAAKFFDVPCYRARNRENRLATRLRVPAQRIAVHHLDAGAGQRVAQRVR